MKKNKLISICLCLAALFTSQRVDCRCIKYDYIIVGNGTAGAVLARKLSDNRHKKVLVLEAGINHNEDPTVLDVNFANLSDQFFNFWSLTNDPIYAETYSAKVFFPLQNIVCSEGKGWGGSSGHNYTVAVRGDPDYYDRVAKISGNDQWSYKAMLPLMKSLEHFTTCTAPINLEQRGVNGPLHISLSNFTATPDPYFDALAAPGNFNVGTISDYNDPTDTSSIGDHHNLGMSTIQSFARLDTPCGFNGTRSFSSNAFLPPSVVTPEGKGVKRCLDIRSNSYVSRVIMHGNKAVGVEFISGEKANKICKAYGKKIILCAGSINSPAILQRSGIGDPEILEPLGIQVVVDNPNVGRNGLNNVGVEGVIFLPTNSGTILLTNLSSSPPLPAPYAYPNDDTRRYEIEAFSPVPGITSFVAYLAEPESISTVQIVSRSPLVQPLLNLNPYSDVPGDAPYLTHGSDANKTLTLLKILNNAVLAGGGFMIAPPSGLSDAELFGFAISPDAFLDANHYFGTTRMGQSIKEGVVDGDLNVFGAENLMVADIGVLPISSGGDPCYSAYLVGLRAATILSNRPCSRPTIWSAGKKRGIGQRCRSQK